MTTSAEVKERFEAVLRQEALADRTMYDAPGFFDELPLYSRYRQIVFLSRFGDVNDLLVELSVDYLQSIVQTKRSSAECFAAITLMDYADAEFVVPNIFVCNGWLARRLRRLRLAPPASRFAKSLQRYLGRANLATRFAVAQDTLSSPGNIRLFLGYRKPPAEHIVPLPALAKILTTSTRAAS
jgi:hypothetical protein